MYKFTCRIFSNKGVLKFDTQAPNVDEAEEKAWSFVFKNENFFKGIVTIETDLCFV